MADGRKAKAALFHLGFTLDDNPGAKMRFSPLGLTLLLTSLLAGALAEEAAVRYSWKEWNSTPTPREGLWLDNYNEFAKIFFTDQSFHRIVFTADKPVSDAWLAFYSYKNEPFTHRIGINKSVNFEYSKDNGAYDKEKLILIPAPGIAKGKNVLWVESEWCAVKLLVNFIDGSQLVVEGSPEWQSSSVKRAGWESADYAGPVEETRFRLGHEGYHTLINKFASHPYAGLIEVSLNRGHPVFKEGEEAEWTVSIPESFYGLQRPPLTITIQDSVDHSTLSVLHGDYLKSEGGRHVYAAKARLAKPGAYDVTISFGDKTALQRKEELVVCGQIKQRTVERADELISSLNLKKICEIDCADTEKLPPVQGHLPSKAPSGKVVASEGMKYFETGKNTGFLANPNEVEYAMWKLHVDDLNEWHMAEFEIPDDKTRVQINAVLHGMASHEFPAESTVELGNPRPLSNGFYKHRMLFIPRLHELWGLVAPSPSKHAHSGAAVAKISIYKIEGGLPALRLGGSGRINANYNERSNIVGMNYYPGSDLDQFFKNRSMLGPNQYRRWYMAIQKHIEYARFIGQNAGCHGLYQYVMPEYPLENASTDYLEMMLDMYDVNGMSFYGNIEYVSSKELEGLDVIGHNVSSMRVTDGEVTKGKDTCRLVSKDGKQASGFQFNNPCHPLVKADILRIAGDLSTRYAAHPSFKGLFMFAGTMGCATNFRGPEWGYDDCSWRLFRNSSSAVPDFQGPDRFQKRYEWAKAKAWPAWEAFRCQKVYELNKAVAAEMRKHSPGAKLLIDVCAWPWDGNIGKCSPAELKQRLIGTGTDVSLFAKDPSMLLVGNDWAGQHIAGEEQALTETYNRNPEVWAYVSQGKPCGVFFWTGFYEMALYFPRELSNPSWLDEGGIVNAEKRFIGSAGKAGRNYLSSFTNALAYADPVFFSNRFTDVAEHRGFIEQCAEAAQAISFIPQGSYKLQPGSTRDIVLKRSGNDAYVVNNTPYSAKAELRLKGKAPSASMPAIGVKLDLARAGSGDGVYSVQLEMKPYQTVPLKLENADWIEMALPVSGR